ncbi:MAG: HD domain-containing protein [Desulfocapsa sp.]|nr:HD domain-containing protein [Desulfocapsa sp.]
MVLGWIVLSLVIGGIVGYLEIERIDSYVVDLAQSDSARLTDAYHNYYHDPSPKNEVALEETAGISVHSGHFVLAEVYDHDKEKVVENALDKIEPIVNLLEEKQHTFMMTDKTNYMKVFYNRAMFLKIVSPIYDYENTTEIAGYFEGIYHVPQEQLRGIGLWLVWSIVQVFIAILLATVILYPAIISLNKNLIQRTIDLSTANLGMLQVLGGAVAKRDSDTSSHNFRVTIYAIRLAEKAGLGSGEIQALIKGAFLHDVGKIGISDTILLKPGKLDADEVQVMQQHVRHGVDIIEHYAWLGDAVDVVRYHHEKVDGSGYLGGLKGEEIPLNARIFAIADVFDALTSKRPYKEPFPFEVSMSIIEEGKGAHYDPDLVEAFCTIARPLYDLLSGNEDENALRDLLEESLRWYFK